MSRPRLALLAAWGLLAVAIVASQFGADGDQTATGDPAGPPEALADRASDDPPEVGAVQAATPDPVGPPPSDPPIASIPRPSGPATIATVVGRGVASLAEPAEGEPVFWFANPTEYGGDRTFLVVDDRSSPDYVKVSLPVMPNGQEGWLPRSEVELATVTQRAEVDLSDFSVTVWDGTEVVVTTGAVIGRETAPTPVGTFYVRDIIAQANPAGDYGPWILALSGFSETLTSFGGALPALALHGTDEPERIGSAASAGCIRIPNEVITLLAETVPLGTPVTIVA